MAGPVFSAPSLWAHPAARSALKGILYVFVWTAVTLACGLVGFLWPVWDVPDPGPGAGFGMLLYGVYGLCLGAGMGLIAVGGVAKVLSARKASRGAG